MGNDHEVAHHERVNLESGEVHFKLAACKAVAVSHHVFMQLQCRWAWTWKLVPQITKLDMSNGQRGASSKRDVVEPRAWGLLQHEHLSSKLKLKLTLLTAARRFMRSCRASIDEHIQPLRCEHCYLARSGAEKAWQKYASESKDSHLVRRQ